MEPIIRNKRKTTPGNTGEYVKVINVDDDTDLQKFAESEYGYDANNINDNDITNNNSNQDNEFSDLFNDMQLGGDSYNETGDTQFLNNQPAQAHDEPLSKDQMPDDKLRIESAKLATNISRLMSDVTSNDIVSISDKITDFIRNHKIGSVKSQN